MANWRWLSFIATPMFGPWVMAFRPRPEFNCCQTSLFPISHLSRSSSDEREKWNHLAAPTLNNNTHNNSSLIFSNQSTSFWSWWSFERDDEIRFWTKSICNPVYFNFKQTKNAAGDYLIVSCPILLWSELMATRNLARPRPDLGPGRLPRKFRKWAPR